MRVPKTIASLTKLREWVDENSPSVLEINDDCELLKIWEFRLDNPFEPGKRWTTFNGIEISYV